MKVAWTIAASDSSAGAGIQADLSTFAHFGVHGCSVISMLTAQNVAGIDSVYSLPDEIFLKQLHALNQDLKPSVIKISVLGSQNQLDILTDFLNKNPNNIIYDPIFFSSSNVQLTNTHQKHDICNKLLPCVTLLTPNIPEAEYLSGIQINSYEDMYVAGRTLLSYSVKNVLIKGGHLDLDKACDLFMNKQESFWVVSNKQHNFKHDETTQINIHGTGCHLSSAIAANLALGVEIKDAVILAKRYLNSAIRNAYLLGDVVKQYYIPQFSFNYVILEQIQSPGGRKATPPTNSRSGALQQTWNLNMNEYTPDMPIVISSIKQLEAQNIQPFKASEVIGLYPIVDNSVLIKRLAILGVKTIQLRVKTGSINYIEDEIIQSIQIANDYKVKLYINDYWQLAIKHNAYGVHLGQEDLSSADINAILKANLRLGVSTHCYYELARALAYKPSYIALGPIFPTITKIMPWVEQGVAKLVEWANMCNTQIVAIGGINLHNIDSVLNTGVKNIALISAITKADNLDITVHNLLKKIYA